RKVLLSVALAARPRWGPARWARMSPATAGVRVSGEFPGPARLVAHGSALVVPDSEASDMHLNADPVLADSLHEHLRLGDGLAARVAALASPGTAPHSGDRIVRKSAIGELVSNEAAESFCVHGTLPGRREKQPARFTRDPQAGGGRMWRA